MDQIEKEMTGDYDGWSIQKLEKTFRETILSAARKHIKKKRSTQRQE